MSFLFSESLLTLHDAAQLLPANRSGKRVNFATVWRWALRGVRAANGRMVRLEAIRVGGRWLTSREALERFATALTPSLPNETPAPDTPSVRNRSVQGAKAKLAKARI